MLEWMRDSSIMQCFRFRTVPSQIQAEEFVTSSFTAHTRHYAVVDRNDEYQGTISLKEIDKDNKTAEYAVAMRQCAQGTGAAREATEEILLTAFEELALKRVYLNVLANNLRACKFYEKFGFIYEGSFRQHLVIDGVSQDLKWYGILKEEFLRKKVVNHDHQ